MFNGTCTGKCRGENITFIAVGVFYQCYCWYTSWLYSSTSSYSVYWHFLFFFLSLHPPQPTRARLSVTVIYMFIYEMIMILPLNFRTIGLPPFYGEQRYCSSPSKHTAILMETPRTVLLCIRAVIETLIRIHLTKWRGNAQSFFPLRDDNLCTQSIVFPSCKLDEHTL